MSMNFFEFNNEFLFYLILCVLITVLLIAVILLGIRKKKKRHIQAIIPRISYGSVSVFFDKDENVVVIPYVKDKRGVGRAIGNPQFLKAPYKPHELGEVVRTSFNLCRSKPAAKSEQLMSKLDCSDWKDFSEGKRNISMYFKEELGLVLNTTRRISDGSYQFNFRGYEKVLDTSVGNEEIGVILKNMLERCKC